MARLHKRHHADKLTGNRERLEQFIDQRVNELRISWQEISRTTDYNVSLYRRIRHDHTSTLTVHVARALERALGWRTHSVELILNGDFPQIDFESIDGQILRRWSQRLSRNDFHELVNDLRQIRTAALQEGKLRARHEAEAQDTDTNSESRNAE